MLPLRQKQKRMVGKTSLFLASKSLLLARLNKVGVGQVCSLAARSGVLQGISPVTVPRQWFRGPGPNTDRPAPGSAGWRPRYGSARRDGGTSLVPVNILRPVGAVGARRCALPLR